MIKYLTETVSDTLLSKNFAPLFQEVLDKRAAEGWKLFDFHFSKNMGICVIVFEKEIDE